VGRSKQGTAVIATGEQYVPRVGDTVLVIAGANGEHYVVGVLAALRAVPQEIVAPSGARARLEVGDAVERLELRDGHGRLVVEYDVASSKLVVHSESDVELRSDGGKVSLRGAEGVVIESGHDVSMIGRTVRVATTHVSPDARVPSVTVDARAARIEGPVVEVDATRADVSVAQARLVAKAVATTADQVKTVAGIVETQADRIVERARNVYRDVAELAQTRAGQLRLFARETIQLLGRRAHVKAKEDVKVKGEKIYLA
jgi:hypothetical protein